MKNKIGVDIKNREKYVGNHLVSLISVNYAMGLCDLHFHTIDKTVRYISTDDNAHMYLFNKFFENKKLTKSNNYFKANIKITDDRFMEDGPNHCGLSCNTIHQLSMLKLLFIKIKSKTMRNR